MSDGKKIQITRATVYEAPQVTEESLDSGGNYVRLSDPEWKMSSSGGSFGTLGNSDNLNG